MKLENVCFAERELVFLFFGMFRKLCGMNEEQFGLRIGCSRQNVNQLEEPGKVLLKHEEEIENIYINKSKDTYTLAKKFEIIREAIGEVVKQENPKKGKGTKNAVRTTGLNMQCYICFRQFLAHTYKQTTATEPEKKRTFQYLLYLLDEFSGVSEEEQKEIYNAFIRGAKYTAKSSKITEKHEYEEYLKELLGKGGLEELEFKDLDKTIKAEKYDEMEWYRRYQDNVEKNNNDDNEKTASMNSTIDFMLARNYPEEDILEICKKSHHLEAPEIEKVKEIIKEKKECKDGIDAVNQLMNSIK